MFNGTTMQPQFQIVGWVERPTGLPDVMPYTLLDDDEDGEATAVRRSANGGARSANNRGYLDQDSDIPFFISVCPDRPL
jgi:hypothetical protein